MNPAIGFLFKTSWKYIYIYIHNLQLAFISQLATADKMRHLFSLLLTEIKNPVFQKFQNTVLIVNCISRCNNSNSNNNT